jgi:hypothetical protein
MRHSGGQRPGICQRQAFGMGRETTDCLERHPARKAATETFVERYNRTVRHEWLDQYIIESIEEGTGIRHAVAGRTTINRPIWASAAYRPRRH